MTLEAIAPFVLALVAPLVASPAPSATPVELREIGHVRATVLCTTLAEGVAPAVRALTQNDRLVATGHATFTKMSRDVSEHSRASMEMEKMHLQIVEARMAGNLRDLEALLRDHRLFPDPSSEGALPQPNPMKLQLEFVADAQRKALDLFSGVLDTEALGQMQAEISTEMKSVTGNYTPEAAGPIVDPPVSTLGSAGLPEDPPAAGLPTVASRLSTLRGRTVYDWLAAVVEDQQRTLARREDTLSSAVIAAVNACQGSLNAQPAPASSPAP